MSYRYEGATLTCDGVALADIAEATGTPAYVYSAADIVSRYRAYDEAFGSLPHQVCYAVKANSNLSLLRLLHEQGAGFDIVSGGELYRVLQAGGDPGKIVFSGVGKTRDEIDYALRSNIHSFNCESDAELKLIDALAARFGLKARVAIRVNPNVDASTHPYISTGMREHKFGIAIEVVEALYREAMQLQNLSIEGVSCHIGSQLLDSGPMMEAVDIMLSLVQRLREMHVPLTFLDLGGGLGVPYSAQQNAPSIGDVIGCMRDKVAHLKLKIMVEPGRSIVGESGVLLSRVLYRKRTEHKTFLVVDAAMNDLIRPALYQAHHEMLPVRKSSGSMRADVVGPVCESADFLARDRELPELLPGDLVAISTAGAYGFVQSSNYNSRPRAAEVMVTDGQFRVVRQRETYEDLIRGE